VSNQVSQAWKTIVTVVLLLVVGGYAYYLSRQPSEQNPKLNQISASDIQRIELRSAGRDIVIERGKAGWHFVQPIRGDVDQTTADSMADAIANLQITGTINDASGDLAPFGLKNPAVNVIVTTKDHHILPTIMVGKDTPVGNSAYIKSSQRPGILLVANTFPSEVEKSVDDLRSRTLIGFKPDEVQEVVLDSGNGNLLQLKKKGDQWQIAKPRPYPADNNAVQQLLDTVSNARIAEFVDDNPSDLAKYGLGNPSLKLILYGGKSRSEESLLFGFKLPQPEKGTLYARRGEGSDQPVVTVDNYVFNALNKSFDDLRDKTVLGLDRSKVDHIIISSPKFTETLARSDGNKWSITSNDKSAPAETLVAESLLDQLRNLKADRIVENPMTNPERYGMVKPTLTLTAYSKDGKELGLLRVSRMEITITPKNVNPETAETEKPQKQTFAYATAGTDKAVYEIPLQAATDLENTVNRLYSDTTTSRPKASPSSTNSAHH
jgi:hypothetical protein